MAKLFMARLEPVRNSEWDIKIKDINIWCAHACVGRYWKGNASIPIWAFENAEDYTAFVLRWLE